MNQPPPNWDAKAHSAEHSNLWLILSLVANVFLVIFLYVATRPLGVPVLPPAPVDTNTLLKTNVVVRHENFTWDQLESTNYALYVSNLRAIGCPEQTIRDIVVSEVDRAFALRKLDEVTYPNYQWWKTVPDPAVVQVAAAKLESLETERQGMLTALLGNDWSKRSNEEIAAAAGITLTGPVLGDLSLDTRQAVFAIAAKGELKLESYQAGQIKVGKPADPMDVVRLREEPFTQLYGVLSQPQYEEYILRYSPSGDQLRRQLHSLQLTPDVFSNLFNAEFSITSQPVFYYAGTDSALLGQEQQLHAQDDAVLKSVLGEQLYAAYQLADDPAYLSSRVLAQQLGVPNSLVTPIYEINHATQTELARIRKDDTLSSDDKVEAISQVQVEQQQSLEQLLGPDAFARYLQVNTNFH